MLLLLLLLGAAMAFRVGGVWMLPLSFSSLECVCPIEDELPELPAPPPTAAAAARDELLVVVPVPPV